MAKHIIWDVDGTLYKSDPEIKKRFREIYAQVVRRKLQVDFSEVEKWFLLKKKRFKSSTITFLSLGIGSLQQLAEFFDENIIPKLNLRKTKQPKELFEKLKAYKHYALRNGTKKGTIDILRRLGFDFPKTDRRRAPKPFTSVWGTIDDIGVPKPHPAVFEFTRAKIFFREMKRLPKSEKEARDFASQNCLIIGDREEVDLAPARELGFRTLLTHGLPKAEEVQQILPFK